MPEKGSPYAPGSQVSPVHAPTRQHHGQVCRTLRESIYRAAHGHESLKVLAGELDLAPSTLSACTILGEGEHVRPFPAEKLADLCRTTQDISPLLTLADMLGYSVIQREQLSDMISDLEITARKLKGIGGER